MNTAGRKGFRFCRPNNALSHCRWQRAFCGAAIANNRCSGERQSPDTAIFLDGKVAVLV